MLIINNEVPCYDATQHLYYLEDEDDIFDSITILKETFLEVTKKRAIWGEKNTPFWFKITICNNSTTDQDIIFDIAYENINRVEFYKYSDDSQSVHLLLTIGNKVDFNTWPIQNRHNPLPYTLLKNEQTTFLIKAEYSREVQFPLSIRKRDNYYLNELKQRNILGMYTGFLLMIIVLNSFFYYNFKDNIYVWYILLCATIGIAVLTFEGLHIPFLVSKSKWLAINLDIFNAYIGVLASFMFFTRFLEIKKYTSIIYKILYAICFITTLVVITFFITENHYIFIAEYLLVSLSFILYLMSGAVIMRKGFVHARTFVLAYSVLLISIISWVISDYFIDVYKRVSSEREMMIGSIIEMTVLSYALSARMKQLQEENEKIRKQLIQYVNEIEELKLLLNSKSETENNDDELTKEWGLSSREIDVLKLISNGFANKEIANKLYISLNTVKFHTKHIYEKLNATNRVEALIKVHEL